MRDWQWLHFQPPNNGPISDWNIISFFRPNVNLTLRQRAFPVQLCSTRSHLPWAPDFNTPFLKHHLRARSGPKRVFVMQEHACRQWANQPTTRGTAKRTGKKSSGKPFLAINSQNNLRLWLTYPSLDRLSRYTAQVSTFNTIPPSEERRRAYLLR
jgi:hypothetical protein